jgi:hypothetical protein
MPRDDFSAPVKALLAQRAGYHCSYPGCGQLTIGPAASGGAINIGVAAHITAASSGGKRHDEELTPDERAGYSNGIWMCQNHAHAIDVDEPCTVEQLQAWKKSAEASVRERVLVPGGEGKVLSFDLADVYPGAPVNHAIGTTLERCGIAKAWGSSEHGCVQDLLIEVALNALSHGRAQRVGLNIEPLKITLYDDGTPFDPFRQLPVGEARGGSAAVGYIRGKHGLDLLLTHRHHNGLNELVIMRVENLQRENLPLDPCTLSIPEEAIYEYPAEQTIDFRQSTGCGDVVVILPMFLALSHAYVAVKILSAAFPSAPPPQLHLVVSKCSEHAVQTLERGLPGARVLRASW